MYENYFNLNETPFNDAFSAKYIYLSKTHLEALESFKHAVEHGQGILMLTGDVGTGKTSIIKRFMVEIGDNAIFSTISNPDLELIDFFTILADELGIGAKIASKSDFLISFKKFLYKSFEKGKKVILIIDEAHGLSQNLLDEIRMLSNIEVPDYKMLNILLVGQTEFNDLVSEPQNSSLRQRICYNYFLEPLSENETIKLILHRIKCAGATSNIFNADALQSIYHYTSGYPRSIVTLCDRALLSGYSKSVRVIGKDIIDESARELNLTRFEQKKEKDELVDDYSTVEFSLGKLDQIEQENIINDLREKIKSQKPQRPVKYKKWHLALAFGILIVLTSIGFHFIKKFVNPEPALLTEKEKKIEISKNYSIDEDSRENIYDSNQKSLRKKEVLADKKKSSSDIAQVDSIINDGKIASQKKVLSDTTKTKSNILSKASDGEIQTKRKTQEISDKKSAQVTQKAENTRVEKTTETPKTAIAKIKSSGDKSESIKTKSTEANKIQSTVISEPLENKATTEKGVLAAKNDKNAQSNKNNNKIMPEKESKVAPPVQQNSQQGSESNMDSDMLQQNPSYTSQIENKISKQDDINTPELSELNEPNEINQQIFSQGSKKIETASVLDEKLNSATLKDRLQAFLQKYCDTYKSKQLDNFLAYFSIDAKENGKSFKALIPKYRHNFETIEKIEYNITLEKFLHDKISDSVKLEGKFFLRWQLYNGPWRENSGKIFMDLLKNGDSFKVLNLDYYGSHPKKKRSN